MLIGAHAKLDTAVADAYGWPIDISDEKALANLLEFNLPREAVGATRKAANISTPRPPTPKDPTDSDDESMLKEAILHDLIVRRAY